MNIDELDWKDDARHKEVAHWKAKYKRTVRLCKAIKSYWPYIEEIQMRLEQEDDCAVSQLWNELDYPVQKLLITAPLHGGPFTTAEVKKIKELWDISTDDLEGR